MRHKKRNVGLVPLRNRTTKTNLYLVELWAGRHLVTREEYATRAGAKSALHSLKGYGK